MTIEELINIKLKEFPVQGVKKNKDGSIDFDMNVGHGILIVICLLQEINQNLKEIKKIL